MKKLLFVLTASLCFLFAHGQTNVSGGIFSNTTWSKANSPYIVTGDIAIYPGDTLIIEPGVVVKVNDNYKIIVRGVLLAKGTINDTIQFISNSSTPTKSKWVGLQIENDLGGRVQVAYFRGSHADFLFKTTANSVGEVLNISHSSIINNNYAIWGTDYPSFSIVVTNSLFYDNWRAFTYYQKGLIDSCIFKKGFEGIHSGGYNNITVNNCEFSGFTESTTRTSGTYTNCKFYNNVNGLKLWPDLHLINCEVFNNTNGIVLYYSLQPTNFSFTNTCVYDNTIYDIKHLHNYNIDLSQIIWKETDSIKITTKIYDAHDDINLGIVNFSASNQYSNSTGIVEVKKPTVFKVYPNPFTTQTTLYTEIYFNDATLTVYNSFGRVVKQIKNISGQTITLYRDNLSCGLYFLQFTEGDRIFKVDNIVIVDN